MSAKALATFSESKLNSTPNATISFKSAALGGQPGFYSKSISKINAKN